MGTRINLCALRPTRQKGQRDNEDDMTDLENQKAWDWDKTIFVCFSFCCWRGLVCRGTTCSVYYFCVGIRKKSVRNASHSVTISLLVLCCLFFFYTGHLTTLSALFSFSMLPILSAPSNLPTFYAFIIYFFFFAELLLFFLTKQNVMGNVKSCLLCELWCFF